MGRNRKRKFFSKMVIRLLIFLLIVGLGVFCGAASYKYVVNSEKASNNRQLENIDPENGIKIEIPMGSNTTSIANLLKEKGVIEYPFLFKVLSKINGYDGTYKSGIHVIRKGVNYNNLAGYEELMAILSSKPLDNPTVKVTVPEGLTYNQIVELLHEKGVVNKEKFNTIAENEKFDYKFLKGIPEGRKPRLEGYLFPDTYIFDKKAGEKAVIDKMLQNFDRKFKPEYYERAKELNMTVDNIITLASIIEREARIPEERDIIAGIFYNRLNNKDETLRKLQSCATIQYIYLNEEGIIKEKITEEDTKMDHPYNTYIIEGLPPGPISCPGEASLIAALYPEKTDYLYFVAKGDGSHIFSKTFREHVNAMNRLNQN